MAKNTHSATPDPDVMVAVVDVHHKHLRIQVDDLGESISTLETQQTHLKKSIDTLNSSNTTFQKQYDILVCSVPIHFPWRT